MMEGVCPDCAGTVTTTIHVCENHETHDETVCDQRGSLWDCYGRAAEHGLESTVTERITEREPAGADTAERLSAADDLAALERPVGVCSLNAEAACRAAIERHDLADDVDAIVGRDTVGPVKPDPAPLLAAVDALRVAPADAFYIGNREKDAETARRAGVRFAYVSGDGPSE